MPRQDQLCSFFYHTAVHKLRKRSVFQRTVLFSIHLWDTNDNTIIQYRVKKDKESCREKFKLRLCASAIQIYCTWSMSSLQAHYCFRVLMATNRARLSLHPSIFIFNTTGFPCIRPGLFFIRSNSPGDTFYAILKLPTLPQSKSTPHTFWRRDIFIWPEYLLLWNPAQWPFSSLKSNLLKLGQDFPKRRNIVDNKVPHYVSVPFSSCLQRAFLGMHIAFLENSLAQNE